MQETKKTLTQDQRIVSWNEERLLIKTPEDLDPINEMSFILEEVIEGLTTVESEQARKYALILAKSIASGHLPSIISRIEQYLTTETNVDYSANIENFVDALGDIKVFSTGSIRKAGYDPDLAMEEVLKEIESRVGSVQNGKFVKDKSPEAQANWYKADFSKAKI